MKSPEHLRPCENAENEHVYTSVGTHMRQTAARQYFIFQIDFNATQNWGRRHAYSSAAYPTCLVSSSSGWGGSNENSCGYQLAVDDFHICDTCQEEAIPVSDEGHVCSRRLLGWRVWVLRIGCQHPAMWQLTNGHACEWVEALSAAAIRLPDAADQPLRPLAGRWNAGRAGMYRDPERGR